MKPVLRRKESKEDGSNPELKSKTAAPLPAKTPKLLRVF
jgi:hypothetical protein